MRSYKILKANQRVADHMALQRLDILRPIISIGPQVDEYLVVSILIRNSGASPATYLQMSLDTDFYVFATNSEERNLKRFAAFNHPVSAFAAGSELRFDLAQGFELDKLDGEKMLTPMQFKIRACYEFGQNKFDEETYIDLRPYMNSTKGRLKLNDELQKIREAIERIANKR